MKSAAFHTGSLAGSHAVFAAAYRQFGAVVAEDLQTVYDQAKALATLRPSKGKRVLIIFTSGGAATILISFGDPIQRGDEMIKYLAGSIKARLAVSYICGGELEAKDGLSIQRAGIPVFPSPERVIRAVAATVWKAEYCRARGQE